MPYPIDRKLLIAVASSALFDLEESDTIYREQGLEEYRKYQRQCEDAALSPGVAFPLVRRLLRLNKGIPEPDAPVEVVLLSRNDPDTGLRVFNSIESHGLTIRRAAFVGGGNPFRYMDAFNASLFVSANVDDVRNAIESGLPAGRVFPTAFEDTDDDLELRIAFDFDGVVADDSSETVFRAEGLEAYHETEAQLATQPLNRGPLARFSARLRAYSALRRSRRQKKRGMCPNCARRLLPHVARRRTNAS